jgi:subtilase-type serine protease
MFFMYAFSGADSVHSPLSPSFQRARRKLLSFVSAVAISIALPTVPALSQEAGKYFNADGTKTDELEKAAQSWRDDPEFKKSWGVRGLKAEYAYALGITGKDKKTGKRIKIGSMDSGYDDLHPELSDKSRFHAVSAAENNPDKVSGKWIKGVNDSHGTLVAGTIAAAQDGKGMLGVAFDAEFYSGNTYADDDLWFGAAPQPEFAKSTPAYIASTYDALVAQDVRIISSSWGSQPPSETYATLSDLQAAFRQHDGKNTWIQGPIRAALGQDGKEGVVINFSAGNKGYDNASMRGSLPYFHPELEGHWMTTTGFLEPEGNDLNQTYNRCGIAKYWCVAAPTFVTSTEEGGGYRSDFNGTSAAAPHASAALALIMQRYPYMTNEQSLTVLFTTAQTMVEKEVHAPTAGTRDDTAVITSETGLPNATTGWGLIDLKKAMNGPGQFLSRFNANLGEGVSDTWSNDISQVALDQRQGEEQQETKAWLARKTELGLKDGIPANLVETLAGTIVNDVPKGKELLKAAIAANIEGNYSSEKLEAALAAAGANAVGSRLLALYEKSHPGWARGFSTETDYANFIAPYADDSALAKPLAALAAEAIKVEYTATELRTAYLATKLADPQSYDAGLTKSGAGALTLAGKNTYRGDTIVDGGELAIAESGSIISNTIVNEGLFAVDGTAADATINGAGVLGGNGQIANLSVNGGGIVAPGRSVGTLHVSGDATFNPGSIFDVEIMADKSAADRLDVQGKAYLLGGIVSVRPEAREKPLTPSELVALRDRPYTILTAGGGVTGMFDAASTGYVFIGASLGYDATSVNATLSRNAIAFASMGSTTNERALLGGIDSSGFGNRLHDMIVVADNREMPAAVASAINEGLIAPTLAGVLARDASAIGNAAQNRIRAAFGGVSVKQQAAIASPLAYAPAQGLKTGDAFDAVTPPPATTALWGEAYGGRAHAAGDGNAAGYSRDTGGFVTGLDGIVAETWRMGVLAGYGNTSLGSGASKASVDSYSVGLYGGTAWDDLRLSLGTALGQNEIDTDRTADFGGLAGRHSASYDAKSVQVFGELGYAVRSAYADFEPFAAASHVHLKTGGFQENGEISNLTGLGGTTDLTTTTLGLRASRAFALGERVSLTARGLLGWSHVFGDVTPAAKLAFAGGQPFAAQGLAVARDTGIVEAGFDFTLSPSKGISGKATTLGLTYSGQFSDSASNNALKADLTVRF